ncbi:hypothetical protein HYFRA_00008105 [Hymenoscyphus fraxineus]|uniref:Uncharacterized protein n=1 Tax=Hymenoscyphus fraxineus TaxID=746836 RepID=A0A9N9L9E2_9HELO|nr:hypothetical protein HYFRA_00008105 [Hymenoscyphus fraxineus]
MDISDAYLRGAFETPKTRKDIELRDMDPNDNETRRGGDNAPKNYRAEGEIDFFKPRKDYHRRANILTFMCCGLLVALIAVSAAFGAERQKAASTNKDGCIEGAPSVSTITVSASSSITIKSTETMTSSTVSNITIPVTITSTQVTTMKQTDPPVTITSSVKFTPLMDVTVTCSTKQYTWTDLLRCPYGGRCTKLNPTPKREAAKREILAKPTEG